MNKDLRSAIVAPRARICEASAAGIAAAASLLRAEQLVAFPTETVYGLGADATSKAAVARIYAAKRRPSFNPLIAHVSSLEEAKAQGVFSREANQLAERFWPGPLTLVLPLAPHATVCDLARASQATIALRIPSHPAALSLIAAVGRPLAAPSANRSGRVSPVSAAHVFEDLSDDIDLILDAGPCPVGVESTIVACLDGPPRLLRPGGLSRALIEETLGVALGGARSEGAIIAPGSLSSHYAPRARLRLDASGVEHGEAGLDFGGRFSAQDAVLDLSPGRNLDEAAANLFGFLRELDAMGSPSIAVAPIPHFGLGEAINDRLKRAAAPRP
ncbi:Threonylcarbamoyl-AMP synthase [Methylocella tundrae]|uniref:Threonylcarbamoyl-AMP synthase n=1 Tax=Methylocella tundrae TaxID=227605 RepID=A0A8B6M5H5_METTU|nr:L-threonylcarbamoyladenylate synthase [Methylocella tundrae]VTZ25852.1 Threonylcarbamoyl-AMP synthase [Methylocella tundrae]VTZ49590.1 Threonylcarbamoyl-AMP synthase [Methylocella tundrae]